MKTILPAFTLLFVWVTAYANLNETDFTVYRDSKYEFSFHYLKTWSPVESTHSMTRFKAVSNYGNGAEDVSINVVEEPNSKGQSPEEHIRFIRKNPQLIVDQLRRNMPSATLVSHGDTKLSNQDAFYVVIDFEYAAAGYSLEYRMIQYQTGRDGVFYTITMRAPKSEWRRNEMIFRHFAARFILHPKVLSKYTEQK